jgi:hypothetical protein
MQRRLLGRLVELLKAATDSFLGVLLRWTSWFGRELTEEGKAEQNAWREQRLRNLRGLGLISRRRHGRGQGS